MGTYVEVKLNEFDELLKAEKGWEREVCGKEYIYNYEMKSFPGLIVKVLTSIKIDTVAARKKGQDAIRVYVVRKIGKEFKGYAKSIRVNRTMNWRDNVKKAFLKQRDVIIARETRKK